MALSRRLPAIIEEPPERDDNLVEGEAGPDRCPAIGNEDIRQVSGIDDRMAAVSSIR